MARAYISAVLYLPVQIGILTMAFLTPTLGSAEIDRQIPVLLIMNERAFAAGSGLVGGLVGNASNNTARAQMDEFAKRTPGIDWTALASEEFACFAVGDRQAGCREATVIDSISEVEDLMRTEGLQHVLVVEFVQMFRVSIRYRARAVVHEYSLTKKNAREIRAFTALYETILPKPLWNTSVEEADRWWAEGSPSRLEADARRSLSELREMAEFVEPQVEDKWSPPKQWRQLPKIATLEESGRAVCVGLPCADVRVYKEHDGRTWLVNDKPLLPVYGVSVASLDDNALLNQSSLFLLVSVPY